MKINGKQDGFVREYFLQGADNMGIDNPNEMIEQVLDSASRRPDFAKQAVYPKHHCTFVLTATGRCR